jgi:hypothetical protein
MSRKAPCPRGFRAARPFEVSEASLPGQGGTPFHGRIDNIDVPEFGHLDMDNAAPLHQRSIAEVLKLIRPGARTAGR